MEIETKTEDRGLTSGRRGGHRSRFLVVMAVLAVSAVLGTMVSPVAADSGRSNRPTGIVVKLDQGRSLDPLLEEHGLRLVAPLLASRNLWLVELDDPDVSEKDREKEIKERTKDLAKEDAVEWAEVDAGDDDPENDRFHAWPEGLPIGLGDEARVWTDQPDLAYLQLDRVHRKVTGDGIVVAILDTGVDLDHPVLQPHLGSGHYDYVDDDDDPSERRNGVDDDGDGLVDDSFGHGTHAAGLVALVAPEAEILVYRVLDDEGNGHPLVVAAAIEDAVDAGADVINLSFGMEAKPKSRALKEAFKYAKKNEVSIVAAAGNDNRKDRQYPAQEDDVLGVAAMGRGNQQLAGFSNHGKPALVAAPGEHIVSTLPGGGFGAWSGTSVATPIVTGQVALIRSAADELEAKKVIEIVGKSSDKIDGKRKIKKGLIDILNSIDE